MLVSASARSAGGMDSLYLGYSLDMAREFIDTAAMWAKSFAPAACEVEECLFKDTKPDGSSDDILAYRIVFASGYEIMALTSGRAHCAAARAWSILDEAAFHDNLNEVMKAALALLMWGGKVVVVSTHDGDTNPFNLLCEEIRKGNKPYALLKITFDDALKDGLYRRICLTRGEGMEPGRGSRLAGRDRRLLRGRRGRGTFRHPPGTVPGRTSRRHCLSAPSGRKRWCCALKDRTPGRSWPTTFRKPRRGTGARRTFCPCWRASRRIWIPMPEKTLPAGAT